MRFIAIFVVLVYCQNGLGATDDDQSSCAECKGSQCPPRMVLKIDDATGCPIATCLCISIEDSLADAKEEEDELPVIQSAPPKCENDCTDEGFCQTGYEFAIDPMTKCSKRPCECVAVGSLGPPLPQVGAIPNEESSYSQSIPLSPQTSDRNKVPSSNNIPCNVLCFCPQQYDARLNPSTGCPVYPCDCIPKSDQEETQYPEVNRLPYQPDGSNERCNVMCVCPATMQAVRDANGCPKYPCECSFQSSGSNNFGNSLSNFFGNFGQTSDDNKQEDKLLAGDDLFSMTSQGRMLEGDILIADHQVDGFRRLYGKGGGSFAGPRGTQNDQRRLWLNNKRGKNYEVPYQFSSIPYSDRSRIENALEDFKKYTCIRFVPRTNERDYIRVVSSSGCYSYVGKIGGGQTLSLQSSGCRSKGTIIHEFMHALGFYHEHSRSDRDSYVRVNTGNIQRGAERNFERMRNSDSLNVRYDYLSVMHYRLNAFSGNRQNTLTPLQYNGNPSLIGNVDNMSNLDIKQINRLYNCEDTGNPSPTTTPTTTTRNPWEPTTPWWLTTRSTTTTKRTTTTPSPTGNCKDFYPRTICESYKRYRYCSRYRRTMKERCQKTCDFCEGDSTFYPTFPGYTTTPKPPCRDRASWCNYFVTNGACYQNFFKTYCQKSCDAC